MTMFNVTMRRERETKRTWRYEELDSGGKPMDVVDAKIGTVYLKKRDWPDGCPEIIKVSVEKVS